MLFTHNRTMPKYLTTRQHSSAEAAASQGQRGAARSGPQPSTSGRTAPRRTMKSDAGHHKIRSPLTSVETTEEDATLSSA
jgi:hypothetical protein